MSFRGPLCLLATAVAVGCSSLNEPRPTLVSVTAVSGPTDLRIGDTVRVSIAIANVSRETVRISAGNCNNDFVIEGANGKVYYPAETIYCLLALYPPVALEPGASFHLEGFTTGRVIPEGSMDAPVMLPAGIYNIRARVGVMKGDEAAVAVRSNPSAVTFRARG